MKLSKSQLIKATKNKILELGYHEIKDTITGANGFFTKSLDNNFYITLGLEISRFYDSMFTASFYLSKTTRWGSVWGDIPSESYERVGSFLTKEERAELLNEEFSKEGVIDAWWDGFKKQEVDKFLKVVEIAEKRFLAQANLFSNIENSIEIKWLVEYVSSVFALINEDRIKDAKYEFVPLKTKDDIPIDWYKAAEKTIRNKKGVLNLNTVKLLAADAWKQKQILLFSDKKQRI